MEILVKTMKNIDVILSNDDTFVRLRLMHAFSLTCPFERVCSVLDHYSYVVCRNRQS